MTTTIASFIDTIRGSRLLEPAKLEELLRTPGVQDVDASTLGQCLVQLGWLTTFQVEELLLGQVGHLILGPYRLLERLGDGSGFKARHPDKDGRFVVKAIRPEQLAEAGVAERLSEAVRIASHLAHPNIARIGPLESFGSQKLYVREYAEGADLARLVRENGALPVAYACDYLHQAAQGLQLAHERGLAHGRLRPENLIVAGSGGLLAATAPANAEPAAAGSTLPPPGAVVKVVDFGMAALSGDVLQPGGLPAGPPLVRKDLADLGSIFALLLTGPGESPAEIKAAPGVLETVQGVVARLLAERPEDGFASATELAQALAPLAGSEPPVADEPLPTPVPVPVPADVPQAVAEPPAEAPPALAMPALAEPALAEPPLAQSVPAESPREMPAAPLPLATPTDFPSAPPVPAAIAPGAFAEPPGYAEAPEVPERELPRRIPPKKRPYDARFWILLVLGALLHIVAIGGFIYLVVSWMGATPVTPSRPKIITIKTKPKAELKPRKELCQGRSPVA